MSEGSAKSTLIKALSPLDACAVESPMTGLGIPDVNYIGGWIECKAMKRWPKNADSQPVRFDHPLSKEQGVWLMRRRKKGGMALVCAKVATSWFFFDGIDAKDYFGKMTRPQMIEKAVLYMPRGLEKERLLEWLRSH